MTVYGFVGPSGTGKSHRALEVAMRYNVACILDDGLLIRENQVLAGTSAKREPSRLASVRRALYSEQSHADQVRRALAGSGAQSVMIIGTSAHMVDEIAKRLELPPIARYIDITDVATTDDIDAARAVRRSEGKHVIPVPTFEVKKDFSGYFIAPLRRLVSRGKKAGASPAKGAYSSESPLSVRRARPKAKDMGDRTVVRPTFSYLGAYSISKAALVQLIEVIALKSGGITRMADVDLIFNDDGLDIDLSVCVKYGERIHHVLRKAAGFLRYEMDRQTSLNIREVRLTAVSLDFTDGDMAEYGKKAAQTI